METDGKIVCPETTFHFCHIAGEHNLRTVDQSDIVTNFFNGRHVVRGKDDRVSGIFQFEDFFFQQFGIYGVESAERFVEDQQLRFVDDGDDELYFLLHSFGQLFEFLVPPRHDIEFFEPAHQPCAGFLIGESFELRQVDGLFADFHFFIQSAFFRQVTDLVDIFRLELASVKTDKAAVGGRDAVDDTDQCGLAGSVRP